MSFLRKNVERGELPNKSLLKNVQNVKISCKNFTPKSKHFKRLQRLPVKSGLHPRMCPQI